MMELENMTIGGNVWNGSEPGTAQTEAYPQEEDSRPLARSSWSHLFLKREQQEGTNLSCSPRTSSYSGALNNVLLAVDDRRDACFFSNSQSMDARPDNDNRSFKRRSARDQDPAKQDQDKAVLPAAALKPPRRRAFASKLGVAPQSSSFQPAYSQDSFVKEEEEFRISSILRNRRESRDEIDADRSDQSCLFTSPASILKRPVLPPMQGFDDWDVEGGFDGDDEDEGSSAMEGLTLELTEADFQTPGFPPSSDECSWRQSRLHHHRSTSRWLPRRFHEAGLGDLEEDSDGSLVPPEQLTTLEEFNVAMQQAATKGDRGRADTLWNEMWHSKSIPPNLQLLNAYTRALAKSLAHPDEAETIAREVCLAGCLSPNATTYTLLTEARLRYEQIFSEI